MRSDSLYSVPRLSERTQFRGVSFRMAQILKMTGKVLLKTLRYGTLLKGTLSHAITRCQLIMWYTIPQSPNPTIQPVLYE